VTGRDKGGLLLPTDTNSKTGLPVGEVLLGKHSNPTPPPESAFEEYEDLPAFINLDIMAGTVMQIASRMQGSAGPGNVEAVSWQAAKVWSSQPQAEGSSGKTHTVAG